MAFNIRIRAAGIVLSNDKVLLNKFEKIPLNSLFNGIFLGHFFVIDYPK